MGKLPTQLHNTALAAREAARVAALAAWASRKPEQKTGETRRTVAVLAGYGNTSYGDYFIGLGTAKALKGQGFETLILGRGSDMRAFANAQVQALTIPDRAHGLRTFQACITERADAFILGGGGIFEDRVDATLSQSLAAGYAARGIRAARTGIPVAVHGIGVEREPYASAGVERLLGRLMRAATTVSVRDSASVEAVARHGATAREVVDPAVIALSHAALPSVAPNGVAAFIPFARKAWPNMSHPDAAAHARQDPDWDHAAQTLGKYERVIIAPFHITDTAYTGRITDAIRRVNPATVVEVTPFTPENPLAVLPILHQCGAAVTMRYHGFMAAHFAGIRDIMVIGESQKLKVTDVLNKAGVLDAHWSKDQAELDISKTMDALLA